MAGLVAALCGLPPASRLRRLGHPPAAWLARRAAPGSTQEQLPSLHLHSTFTPPPMRLHSTSNLAPLAPHSMPVRPSSGHDCTAQRAVRQRRHAALTLHGVTIRKLANLFQNRHGCIFEKYCVKKQSSKQSRFRPMCYDFARARGAAARARAPARPWAWRGGWQRAPRAPRAHCYCTGGAVRTRRGARRRAGRGTGVWCIVVSARETHMITV